MHLCAQKAQHWKALAEAALACAPAPDLTATSRGSQKLNSCTQGEKIDPLKLKIMEIEEQLLRQFREANVTPNISKDDMASIHAIAVERVISRKSGLPEL